MNENLNSEKVSMSEGQCFPCGELGNVTKVGSTRGMNPLDIYFCDECLKHKPRILEVLKLRGCEVVVK